MMYDIAKRRLSAFRWVAFFVSGIRFSVFGWVESGRAREVLG